MYGEKRNVDSKRECQRTKSQTVDNGDDDDDDDDPMGVVIMVGAG